MRRKGKLPAGWIIPGRREQLSIVWSQGKKIGPAFGVAVLTAITALAAFAAEDRPPDEIGPNSRAWIITSSNSAGSDLQLQAQRPAANLVANLDQPDAAFASAIPRLVEMATGMNFW